jgi:hypothetical protein
VPELHFKPRSVFGTRNLANIESYALNYMYSSIRNVDYTAHARADRQNEGTSSQNLTSLAEELHCAGRNNIDQHTANQGIITT